MSMSYVPPASHLGLLLSMKSNPLSSPSFDSLVTFASSVLYQHWAFTCPNFLHTKHYITLRCLLASMG